MRPLVSQTPPAATKYRLFVDIIAKEDVLGFATSQEKIDHNLSVINLAKSAPIHEAVSNSDDQELHQLYLVNHFLILNKIHNGRGKGYMIISNYKVDVSEFFLESFIAGEFSKEMFIHWDKARYDMLQNFRPSNMTITLCLPTLGNLSHMQRMHYGF